MCKKERGKERKKMGRDREIEREGERDREHRKETHYERNILQSFITCSRKVTVDPSILICEIGAQGNRVDQGNFSCS